MIGNVGAIGVATGPNLHNEVLVDGRPTDPLSDDRLAAAADAGRRMKVPRRFCKMSGRVWLNA